MIIRKEGRGIGKEEGEIGRKEANIIVGRKKMVNDEWMEGKKGERKKGRKKGRKQIR